MKSLIQEIGRLVKSALPFAIVSSDPANWFAAMISYRKVSEAVAAGHTWIQVGNGTYTEDSCSASNVIIQASGGASFESNGSAAAFTLSGNYCRIVGGKFSSARGGGASGNHALLVSGSYNVVELTNVPEADDAAVYNYGGSGYNIFALNTVGTISQTYVDGNGIRLEAGNSMAIGNLIGGTSGDALALVSAGTGSVANRLAGVLGISTFDHIMAIGNTYDSISDNKTGGRVDMNHEF